MHELMGELRTIFKGEIKQDDATTTEYSHDASIYELVPEAVLFPRDTTDIARLVKFVRQHKHAYPALSITARGAGTDMSGAAIGNSLVIDMTRHFKTIHSASSTLLHTQPGVFVREIDPILATHNAMLGCVPASRAFNTIGGMVANNSAGEQSLRYGNTDKSVRELKVIFRDGKEYIIKPINKRELDVKMKQTDFEGDIYRRVYQLIETNYDDIKNARPRSHKNSMGYNLWTVWDRETGIFDLTQLITGSQGTLGIITDIKIAPVPKAKHSGLLLAYLTKLKDLDEIIPLVASHHPATFEGFDDLTFSLGIKYFKVFQKQMGMKEWLKQQAYLFGSVAKFKGHLPNIVLMIEFEGDTYEEVNDKLVTLDHDLHAHHIRIRTEIEGNEELSKPFWAIRRASFTLLRQRIKDRYASSFMDDMAIEPQYIADFFPRVRRIIKKYKLAATLSGHFGDGNFHLIPLMDIFSVNDQLKIEPAMRELIPIVLEYKGTMAGEHNDGMVRGPWLPAVFGDKIYALFKQTKEIFDPQFIFNPHKKTDASWDYSMEHIRSHRKDNFYK